METIYYIILAFIAILIVGPVSPPPLFMALMHPSIPRTNSYLPSPLCLSKALLQDRSPIPETSGNVHKVLQPSELDALLVSTAHVVVDFYADWCPPCRAIAPVFSRLADKHAALKGHLAFAKVNVDHVHDVAARYGISAMPTFVFFEGGKPTPVAVPSGAGLKAGPSVVFGGGDGKDGKTGVERVRGADVKALTAVVDALGEKARLAAGISSTEGVQEN